MPVALLDQRRRRENFRQEFRVIPVPDGPHPAKMIQAKIVEPELERVPVQRFRDRLEGLQRCVAHTQNADSRMVQTSLRNDSNRVRKINDRRVRSDALGQARVFQHRRQISHRAGEPAGAHSFLPNQPVSKRNGFVFHACIDAADTNARDHVIRTFHCAVKIGKKSQPGAETASPGHGFRDPSHHREPFTVDVPKGQLF